MRMCRRQIQNNKNSIIIHSMANKKNQTKDELENVQEALTRSEAFIETYRKPLLITLAAIVVVVVAIVLFRSSYLAPREIEAADKMVAPVDYFERDSFALALNGDGVNDGFIAIIDSYGITKTADLAAFYAGVCCYKLGQYEEAVEYLGRFDANTVNAKPVAIGLAGDCYSSMGDYANAVKYYERAASFDNGFTAPIYLKKAGIHYEELGDFAKAEQAYTKIKETYFDSPAAMDIDKYIERARAKR